MLWAILLLPIIHYIADFELQNNWMALGKSKRLWPLTIHVGVYALCFVMVFGPLFGVITFITHFITDYVTSRWTSKLWFFHMTRVDWEGPNNTMRELFEVKVPNTRHQFFCGIGLDQMIHQYTLLLTVLLLDARPWFL